VDFRFPLPQVMLIILSLLVTVAVHLVLQHTFLGKALRAAIQDREAAQTAGSMSTAWRWSLLAWGPAHRPGRSALGAKYVPLSCRGVEATMIAIVVTIFAGLGQVRSILLGGGFWA